MLRLTCATSVAFASASSALDVLKETERLLLAEDGNAEVMRADVAVYANGPDPDSLSGALPQTDFDLDIHAEVPSLSPSVMGVRPELSRADVEVRRDTPAVQTSTRETEEQMPLAGLESDNGTAPMETLHDASLSDAAVSVAESPPSASQGEQGGTAAPQNEEGEEPTARPVPKPAVDPFPYAYLCLMALLWFGVLGGLGTIPEYTVEGLSSWWGSLSPAQALLLELALLAAGAWTGWLQLAQIRGKG